MTFLDIQAVSKKLGEKRVLVSADLSLDRGEIVAIVGASGSGKSTLLRTVNRLIDADGGTITMGGKDIKGMDTMQLRRKVGMVFQIPVLFPGTVRENVSYGLKLQGRSNLKKVKRALKDASLPISYLDRDAERLSVGEQQRVSIARVLAMEPKILLLDEPTASLDPRATRKVEQTITRLKKERGLCILWVTHMPAQASRVADRVAMLKDGFISMVPEGESIEERFGMEVR